VRKNSISSLYFFYAALPFCLMVAFVVLYSIALKIKAYVHDETPNNVSVSLVDSPKETKNLEVRDENEQGKRK
jgi:hypothetical protein